MRNVRSNQDAAEDHNFTQIRRYDLDPEAVTSRRLRDALLKLSQQAGRNPLRLLVVMFAALRHSTIAIFELEKQIIALRKEIRGQ